MITAFAVMVCQTAAANVRRYVRFADQNGTITACCKISASMPFPMPPIATIISHISRTITLHPGNVIYKGTPG